jgi:hypothetical protein
MIYSGNNINIELTNNTKLSLDSARTKGLAIVDIVNCEQLLKEYNLIPQNHKMSIYIV